MLGNTQGTKVIVCFYLSRRQSNFSPEIAANIDKAVNFKQKMFNEVFMIKSSYSQLRMLTIKSMVLCQKSKLKVNAHANLGIFRTIFSKSLIKFNRF